MTKIKILIVSLSVITMLTACGEGFKAKLLGSEAQLDEVVEADKENIPVTEVVRTRHEEILLSYENDFNGLTEADVKALATSVKAFDVEVKYSSHPGGGSDVLQSLVAKMKTSCKANATFTSTAASMTQLRSMQRLSLGSQGAYDVALQCVDSGCSNIVASVHRHGDITEGVILLNLKRTSTLASGNVITEKYTSTAVDIPLVYSTALTVNDYSFRCLQIINNQPLTSGTGSTVNPTTGGVVSGTQTTTNAFGNSVGNAPYFNYDTQGTAF